MSDVNLHDPAGFLALSKDWLSAQKKFAPSGRILAQLAETVRTITQAQLNYSQTVMRANAALIAAALELPATSAESEESEELSERPSKTARRPNVSAP